MLRIEDQLGREIFLESIPKRIVSLVPSLTEYLYDLGLDEEIVGVTKFCIHPESKTKKVVKIGGTKSFNFDKINELKPDLIIANKEENYKEGVEQLEKGFPVFVTDIANLQEALQMMSMLGKILDKESKAQEIINETEKSFNSLNIYPNKGALYLIWRKPYMTVGGDTFINQLMEFAGFNNLRKNFTRYPVVSPEEIKELKPEFILLSSEPYPFKNKHIEEFRILSPSSRIILVDGEMFSWYGSRLRYSAGYFKELAKL